MSLSLYEHQLKVLDKIKNGSILWGGVGSGKSRVSIAYYFMKECNGYLEINGRGKYIPMKNPKDLYIITTAKKRDSLEWEEELIPFLLSTNSDLNTNNINVTIDSWNNIKKYNDIQNAFFIFDEQRVVGYGAWSKTFINISKSNNWILLSATPGDVWSDYIPVFIANGFYKHKTDFTRQHIVYNRFTSFPQIDKYVNQGKLIKYRNDILIHMPFKKHTIRHQHYISVEHDTTQEKFIMINKWNIFEDKPIENASQYTHTLLRLINKDPSRIKAIDPLIKKHKKCIIFYNYNFELENLRQYLTTNDILFAEWNGHKHEAIPIGPKWVYLVQYTSGSEGWNCITTNTIIFFSQNPSYRTMEQAMGRIDRLNTPYKELHYYTLRSQSQIDRRISKALKEKKKFNQVEFFNVKHNSQEKHSL